MVEVVSDTEVQGKPTYDTLKTTKKITNNSSRISKVTGGYSFCFHKGNK